MKHTLRLTSFQVTRTLTSLALLITCVLSAVPAEAYSGTLLGDEVGVEHGYNSSGPVYNKYFEATWLVQNGNVVLRLFSDFYVGDNLAAAVVPVVKSIPMPHTVAFDFKKIKAGLLVGTADPILRIQYTGDNDYETVRLKNMWQLDLPSGWKRAYFTTTAKSIARIGIIARGARVSLVNSARFDVDNIKVDGIGPSGKSLNILKPTEFDQLYSFQY